jgi:hypothetical protein
MMECQILGFVFVCVFGRLDCCWPSLTQLFSVPGPAGILIIFFSHTILGGLTQILYFLLPTTDLTENTETYNDIPCILLQTCTVVETTTKLKYWL